jgi:rhamnosyl/mannosyltransferase
MHIVQIYKDYYPVLGGIENHLRDVGEGLAARGHRVTTLVTGLNGRTVIEEPQPGLTVVKAARTLHAASTPLSIAMLVWARQLRADIVHLHFPYPPGDVAYAAMPCGAPLVITYHSDIVRQRALLRVYRPLLEWTLRHASVIIATSPNYIASSPFLSRFAAKCAVVPLGVDVERFAQADERAVASFREQCGGPLLLFVGRLRYYKGLHVLLDALPHTSARLLIGGSGPERERLEQQATRLGIAERVFFLGDVPDADLPMLYRAADVFVLPAHLRAEAFGIAQIEAMASGVPCISTELGTGTSYANVHGETGLVVSPDDAALAEAINTLVADQELRRRFGAAAHKRANNLLSRERMLDGIEAVYRLVVAKNEG